MKIATILLETSNVALDEINYFLMDKELESFEKLERITEIVVQWNEAADNLARELHDEKVV